MKIIECKQNTPEWQIARIGIPTASCFDKIVTSTGIKSNQKRRYLYTLAAERILKTKEDSFHGTGPMQIGKEREAEARECYELLTGREVKQIGFCLHNDGFGCSPDGIFDDGVIEIKCPTMSVHVEYLDKAILPTKYFVQTQGQLLVTGKEYLDFFSYFPGLPPLLLHVSKDHEFLKTLKKEINCFCKELEELVNKLETTRGSQ